MKILSRIVVLALMMLGGVCLLFILMTIFPTSMKADNVASLKLLQILQSFMVFALPAWICASRWSKGQPYKYLHLKKPNKWWDYFLVIVLMIGFFPIINLLVLWNSHFILPSFFSGLEDVLRQLEQQNQDLIESFLQADSLKILFFNLLVMAVTPALCEELLFRGTIQHLLSDKLGTHAAIWISAIFFSAIHFQFFGFIPRLLLGAVFGYLLVYSGSIFICFLAHFFYNAVSIILYYIGLHNDLSISFDSIGADSYMWTLPVGLILVIGAFYLIINPSRHRDRSIAK